MGNSISKRLDEKYQQQDYQIIGSKQDQLIGPFAIWKFQLSKEIICMYKIFDPNQYEEQSGIQDIINNMFQEQKNICDFYLVKDNQQNYDLYDLVFEYGNPIEIPFPKEKYIWILLEQITEAMIKIEDKGFHYPLIHIQYIVQLDKKVFKMVNPYCFSDFIKDVLRVYTNPQVVVSQRKQFQRKNISKNIQQMGNLLLLLLGQFNSDQLYADVVYRNQCMQHVQSNMSKELLSFLKYIFYDLSNTTPISFKQIKRFLEHNRPKASNRFVRKIMGSKRNKLDYYKPEIDSKQKTKQYLIFDSNRNIDRKQTVKSQLNNKFETNTFQQKRSQPIKNLSTFYMDDFDYQEYQNDQSGQSKVKMNLFQNNFMNDPKFNKPIQTNYDQGNFSNQNAYQNQNDQYYQNTQNHNYNNQNNQFSNQQQNYNVSNQNYQNKNVTNQGNDQQLQIKNNEDDFFKKNTFSLDQQNLLKQDIQAPKQNQADDFFEANEQIQDDKEKTYDYFDENAPFQQENFFESIQDEKQLQIDNNQQKKQDVKDALFQSNHEQQQNETLDKINSTGEIHSEEEQNNYYDDTSSQNSNHEEEKPNIKRVKVKEVFRQGLNEQGYKKYIIYDDGTEEQVQMNQSEQNLFKTHNSTQNEQNVDQQREIANKKLQQNLTEQPQQLYFSQEHSSNQHQNQQQRFSYQNQQNQKFSHGHFQQNNFMPDLTPPPNLLEDLDQTESIDITLMDKENNMHFILYPGEKLNPLVLFRKKTQRNYNFEDIQKIVDFQNKMKPSMYHQIEVDDENYQADPETDAQQCISKINPSFKGTLKSRQTLIKSKFQLMNYNQFKYIVFSL